MAILTNTFDGGTVDTDITAGNSGGASGTAFAAVSVGFKYKGDLPAHGSLCAGVDNPGTTTYVNRWALGSSLKVFAARIYFRHSVATTGTLDLLEVRAPDDTTYLGRVRLNGSNKLSIIDSSGTSIWISAAALPVNTYYCASFLVNTGTTTLDGSARLAYRALGDSSWIEDSGSLTGNMGAGLTAGNMRIGKTSTATYGGNLRFDTYEVRTGTDVSGLILPYSAAVQPITGVLATRVSNTQVSVSWTHPADAPNGVSILRAPGTQVNDPEGDAPGESDYDPSTISGAVTVATGLSSSPYVDTVPTPGVYTYWVSRTP